MSYHEIALGSSDGGCIHAIIEMRNLSSRFLRFDRIVDSPEFEHQEELIPIRNINCVKIGTMTKEDAERDNVPGDRRNVVTVELNNCESILFDGMSDKALEKVRKIIIA